MPYIGEIAAIGTALTWSACALFFTSASRRIGSFSMSHFRMLYGVVLLLTINTIVKGHPVPTDVPPHDMILLILSGLTGFFIADTFLFQSYVDIGPRLGALVFNIYPVFGAFLAWAFLKETLSLKAWLGMTITLSGVIWVVIEKDPNPLRMKGEHFTRGISFAVSASFIQAISFALAKPAMSGTGSADSLSATTIRAVTACAAYWLVSVFRGKLARVTGKFRDRKAMLLIGIGAFFGPSFGVWLSMIAVKYAPIGIAATLMALMPVTILPMTALIYKEKVSWRALIGAVVACLGVAVLLNS